MARTGKKLDPVWAELSMAFVHSDLRNRLLAEQVAKLAFAWMSE